MLTGSTVEQWDTMIFLKETTSPQEYDQAIFRLQNQYVKTMVSDNGKEIKYNMKPQTLLVDFEPMRMFHMQEQKSLIYNVNTDERGNQQLSERIADELRISPIITINNNQIKQVEATDILEAVSEYTSSKSVLDETRGIPVDLSLLDIAEIRSEIERQGEIGSTQGLQIEAVKGDETDLDIPNIDEQGTIDNYEDEKEQIEPKSENVIESEIIKLQNKFRTYYSRILFFSFLTKNKVASLDDILNCIDCEDNQRIIENLNLSKSILTLMKNHMNAFVLSQLDYKVQNINDLSNDESIKPINRALTAIYKFNRLSDYEITTPSIVCEKMISLFPNECFENIKGKNRVIIDIGSKAGEYAIAICKRCEGLNISINDVKNSILSIPTSSVAYEFTRKIYEVLGLNTDSIAQYFNATDILEIKDTAYEINYKKIKSILTQNIPFSKITLYNKISIKEGESLKIEAVVGNPPYQIGDGGAQKSAKPIYQNFVKLAKEVTPEYFSLIMPTRWYAGGKGSELEDFRNEILNDIRIKELHDFLNPERLFPNTNIRGGVCFLLWDKVYDNTSEHTSVATYEDNLTPSIIKRPLKTKDMDIFIRNSEAISILYKVISSSDIKTMVSHISPRKPFGIEGNFIKSNKFHKGIKGLKSPVKCYGKAKTVGYIEKDEISSNIELKENWKVYMPYATNIGTELNDDNLNTFIGEPNSICTETFLLVGVGMDLNEVSAQNLSNYLRTKFVRFLNSLAKISQHGTAKTFRFVPVQDFSKAWTDNELYEKYGLSKKEIAIIENSIKPMDLDANFNEKLYS